VEIGGTSTDGYITTSGRPVPGLIDGIGFVDAERREICLALVLYMYVQCTRPRAYDVATTRNNARLGSIPPSLTVLDEELSR